VAALLPLEMTTRHREHTAGKMRATIEVAFEADELARLTRGLGAHDHKGSLGRCFLSLFRRMGAGNAAICRNVDR
jgi:hypothetical protein